MITPLLRPLHYPHMLQLVGVVGGGRGHHLDSVCGGGGGGGRPGGEVGALRYHGLSVGSSCHLSLVLSDCHEGIVIMLLVHLGGLVWGRGRGREREEM